ncbi:MAG: sulfatase [Planctomycetota bacterium]
MRNAVRTIAALLVFVLGSVAPAAPRPNVLLIVCDDLNDWIEPLGGHPQAHTPSLARFAERAVTFTNGHSNNPVCAPSRASFLTGIYPHTSGNVFWDKWHENPTLSNSKTMMRHFRDQGYTVVGAGKLMHHAKRDEWDEFRVGANLGPAAWDGQRRVGHPSVPEPFRSIGWIDGSFGSLHDVPFAGSSVDGAGWIDGAWGVTRPFRYNGPDDRGRVPDERIADWAVGRLERFADEAGGPFFMALGFLRPHTPMYAPQEHFDLFPDVETTLRLDNDVADTHYNSHFSPEQKGRRYYRLISEAYGSSDEGLRAFSRAYLACVSFIDSQIGRVLDELERQGLAKNTVVVITSDHGFGIGEKSYLFKNAPWEESTRVPLFIRAPGVSVDGGRVSRPVSLIDVYPTLVDLCGLSTETRKNASGAVLDGHTLRSLLVDPIQNEWAGPLAALTMVHAGETAVRSLTAEEWQDPALQHWSLRTATHRYIRYNSGATELYDHRTDPNEWHNLAEKRAHASVVERLDALLREMIAPVELEPLTGSEP